MVSYSLQENTRREVVVWLLVAAFLIGNAAAWIALEFATIDLGDNDWGVRWYSLTVFTVIFLVFNRYAWRIPFVRSYLDLPNLNGTWVGTIDRTEYPGMATENGVPVTVVIKQNFTGMAFSLENKVETTMSGKTTSVSNNISVAGNADTGFILRESFHTGDFFGTTVWTVREDSRATYMTGEYVSRFPRTGELTVHRVPNQHRYMTGLVQKMSDENGKPYLAVAVDKATGKAFLKRLEVLRGRTQVGEWSRKQIERDRGHYHLTIVSPPEYEALSAELVSELEGEMVDYVLGEIGGAEFDEKGTYYVIVNSPHVAYLRERATLPHRDLHVTLAFRDEDIHDVSKGANTKLV